MALMQCRMAFLLFIYCMGAVVLLVTDRRWCHCYILSVFFFFSVADVENAVP